MKHIAKNQKIRIATAALIAGLLVGSTPAFAATPTTTVGSQTHSQKVAARAAAQVVLVAAKAKANASLLKSVTDAKAIMISAVAAAKATFAQSVATARATATGTKKAIHDFVLAAQIKAAALRKSTIATVRASEMATVAAARNTHKVAIAKAVADFKAAIAKK
jgi:hypothetical protein